MSESSQTRGLPRSFNLFFPRSRHFSTHTCFAFLPPLALKGYKILGSARLVQLLEDARRACDAPVPSEGAAHHREF